MRIKILHPYKEGKYIYQVSFTSMSRILGDPCSKLKSTKGRIQIFLAINALATFFWLNLVISNLIGIEYFKEPLASIIWRRLAELMLHLHLSHKLFVILTLI